MRKARFATGVGVGNAQGSAGNAIAAICSFFIPGLGQRVQGRMMTAIVCFVAACIACAVTWILTLSLFRLGWFFVSVFACIDAALFRRPVDGAVAVR